MWQSDGGERRRQYHDGAVSETLLQFHRPAWKSPPTGRCPLPDEREPRMHALLLDANGDGQRDVMLINMITATASFSWTAGGLWCFQPRSTSLPANARSIAQGPLPAGRSGSKAVNVAPAIAVLTGVLLRRLQRINQLACKAAHMRVQAPASSPRSACKPSSGDRCRKLRASAVRNCSPDASGGSNGRSCLDFHHVNRATAPGDVAQPLPPPRWIVRGNRCAARARSSRAFRKPQGVAREP